MSPEKYATTYHAPVLVDEVLQWLDVGPAKRFVDGTAGGGGHSEAILSASGPDGKLLALDRDPRAIKEVETRLSERFESRLQLVQANYSEAARVLGELGWEKVDGFLVDAGVSSHQLDTAERGFSFQQEGPLDMRMGPEAITVAEYLDEVEADELARVLKNFGEIRQARSMARAIIEERQKGKLQTTTDLADLISRRSPPRHHPKAKSIHPATLVFQALRIAVNEELTHLQETVERITDVVKPGGRAVFISFHSLEDRIIKHGFRHLSDPCTCPPDFPRCGCGAVATVEVLTRKPVVASEAETADNPRARSAKLRALRVLTEEERVAL